MNDNKYYSQEDSQFVSKERFCYLLEQAAPEVNRQVEELEEAKRVTQETMRLEFII